MCSFKVTAIVPSAGKGVRFRSKKRKPFAPLGGRPVLYHALKAFQASPLVREIIVVIDKPFLGKAYELVKRYRITKVRHITEGGKTRSNSVRNGLRLVDESSHLVLVHDGVRPFVSDEIIRKSIAAAAKYGAAVSALPVKGTVKMAGKSDFVKYTPDRKKLWEAQTPQVFRKGLIEKAYKGAGRNIFFTDDAAVVENIGARVKIVKGDNNNIKITTIEDLKMAEALLKKRI